MESRYKVGEVMIKNITVSSPNESIYNCARKMTYRKIGSLIIMNNASVVGIVTEQDITRKVVAKGLAVKTTPISVIMSDNVISIMPDKGLQDAIQLMASNEIKHLPIIENGNILGIITSKDIVSIEPLLIELLLLDNSNKFHKNE